MRGGASVWQAAAATAAASPAVSFEQLAIRLAAIGELAAAVHGALDLPSILRAVQRHARWVLDFCGCSLVIADEHAVGYRVLTHPDAGTHPHPGLPIRLSATPGGQRRAAPCFGADNHAVLAEIGLSLDEIRALEASGALARPGRRCWP